MWTFTSTGWTMELRLVGWDYIACHDRSILYKLATDM
jgi:hypothetical protein